MSRNAGDSSFLTDQPTIMGGDWSWPVGAANALNPGLIRTNLLKYVTQEESRKRGYIDANGNLNPNYKTLEQGASTSVWAAVGDELEGIGGLYLADCQEAGVWSDETRTGYMPYARSPESAERLWTLSAEWVDLS